MSENTFRNPSSPAGSDTPGRLPDTGCSCLQCRLTAAHRVLVDGALELHERSRETADRLSRLALDLSEIILRMPLVGGEG